uniref:hypothetical protein n=1 Tax=Paractinoplanes polyasparticus TaxID=2856853 RepID=UPI001C847AD4|nr:hypothetical protein [Actinoplanes polyasparticus]
MTFDLVEFYEGKAAAQACREDGIVTQECVWCAEYYIRNNNPGCADWAPTRGSGAPGWAASPVAH